MKAWVLQLVPDWLIVRLAEKRIRAELERLGIGDLMGKLTGYKTYVAVAIAVVTALGAWLTGDADLRETLQRIWTVAEPLAIGFLAMKGNRILATVNAATVNAAAPVMSNVAK